MPAIRPQDSVFSKPDHVAIHKQATLDDNWSSHVMDKVTSLSKRSVVAVGMVLATTSAMGQTPGTEPNPANAVQQMYEAGMRDKGQLKAWQDARPGLMIDNRVNGQSLSGAKSIAELMGVNPQTVSSDKTMPLFQQLEEALRDSGEYRGMASASTLVVPKAFFHPKDPINESVCTVTVTSGISEVHNEIAEKTGWANDVVRDFVLRHEMSHCIEQGDHNALVMSKLTGKKAEWPSQGMFSGAQPFVSQESREIVDDVIQHMSRNASDHHPEDRVRDELINVRLRSRDDTVTVMSEQVSDSVALLSLIKEGRLKVDDIEKVAALRDEKSGDDHHTFDFLRGLQKTLTDRPDVVKAWQASHQKDVKEGRGLQIDDQLNWLQPIWNEHANGLKKVKDEERALWRQEFSDRFQKAEERLRQSGPDAAPAMAPEEQEAPAKPAVPRMR